MVTEAAEGGEAGINPVARRLFNPAPTNKEQPNLNSLVNALYSHCPTASVFHYVDLGADLPAYSTSADFNVSTVDEVSTSSIVPCSLPDLASHHDSVAGFLAALPTYSEEEVASLADYTAGQADNAEWLRMRDGHITGSIAHRVVTRVRTVQKSHDSHLVDFSNLTQSLMGYVGPNPDIPALKYGRLKEPVAAGCYETLFRQEHQYPKLTFNCGLHVMAQSVYLGASPDGLVECACCGGGDKVSTQHC